MHAPSEEGLLSSESAGQGAQRPQMDRGEDVPMVWKLGAWSLHYLKFLFCLGLFWTADFLLARLLHIWHITFPSSLVGATHYTLFQHCIQSNIEFNTNSVKCPVLLPSIL